MNENNPVGYNTRSPMVEHSNIFLPRETGETTRSDDLHCKVYLMIR